jgi:hypothetical protein
MNNAMPTSHRFCPEGVGVQLADDLPGTGSKSGARHISGNTGKVGARLAREAKYRISPVTARR